MIEYRGITFNNLDSLTDNQMDFIDIALESNLKVYEYSGRGMYGKTCPAVNVDYKSDFPGCERDYRTDSMGLGYVIYTG